MTNTLSGRLLYCKALPLSRVREFPAWPKTNDTAESIVYLHEDGSVTRMPELDSERIFSSVAEDWREFCRDRLGMPPLLLHAASAQAAVSSSF